MRNFITYIGKNIQSDVLIYNIFKFLMLHLNIVYFVVLTTLNVWFYTMMTLHCACEDKIHVVPHPEDTHVLLILLNLIFSGYILLFVIVRNAIEEDRLFDTDSYKQIFRDIEYTKQK